MRRLQIIVSTHSPYVLEELPAEARILLLPTADGPSVLYGASPEFALTKLDEIVHPEAFVYVEDRSAEIWVREILVCHPDGAVVMSRIKISPVGPANVVAMMGKLAEEGKLPQAGIGVLDGDQQEAQGCIKLPGEDAPERVVFLGLRDNNWAGLHERFGVGAGDLHTYLEDALLSPDFHRWPSLVGDRILKSATSVWEIMVTEWCRVCLTDDGRDLFVHAIKRALPD